MKKLQDKWIVTKMDYRRKEGRFLLSAHICDGKAYDFVIQDEENASLLGNIYIGKVQKIVKNINAAFVKVSERQMVYYSLTDNKQHFFVNEKKDGVLKAGDEIVLQIVKEGIRTKEPSGTSKICFTGKYLVLTTDSTKIGISNKLSTEQREYLLKLMEPLKSEKYGFIVRTNAAEASPEMLTAEAGRLAYEYETLLEKAKYRPVFTNLKPSADGICANLKNIRFLEETEIITDDRDVFCRIKNYLEENQPEDVSKLQFYEDALLPLAKLYSLESHLENALGSRVWLKSGGYLIIQPTEALTVIDVNTGKYEGRKNREETFLKINLEAAEEIARQLRVRNLSGIIVIDFISMTGLEGKELLVERLRELLRQDPVKATFVDMTELDLVEITRKKVQKPLCEQLGELCPCCHGNTYLY